MTVYVAEIEGRAIAAFHVENEMAAEAFVESDAFQSDLMVLESDDEPLWDGEADIHCREAVEEERAAWEKSRARAILDGETEADDKDWLVFLVSVTDPTDDEDDDEDEEEDKD
jgi:hypothetical protein